MLPEFLEPCRKQGWALAMRRPIAAGERGPQQLQGVAVRHQQDAERGVLAFQVQDQVDGA